VKVSPAHVFSTVFVEIFALDIFVHLALKFKPWQKLYVAQYRQL